MSLRIQLILQVEHVDGTPVTTASYIETSMNPIIGNHATEAASATGTARQLLERAGEDVVTKLEAWAEAAEEYTARQRQLPPGE